MTTLMEINLGKRQNCIWGTFYLKHVFIVMGIPLSIYSFLEEYFHHVPDLNQRNASRFTVGKAVAVGGGAVCLMALLSPSDSLFNRIAYWPGFMTKRVQDTYCFYGSSAMIGLISMTCFYQCDALVNFLTSDSADAIFAANTVIFVTGCIVNHLSYTEYLSSKHVALLLYTVSIGAVVSPICHLGASVICEAVWMTAVMVVELCLASVYLSTDFVFQILVPPVLIGYLTVDMAAIVGFFFPTGTPLGSRAHQVNLYGGTVVFAGFLVVSSHLIYVIAEILQEEDLYLYDPINAGLLLFYGTVNLFVRVAVLLAYEERFARNTIGANA